VECNFTPVPRYNYRVGVSAGGHWDEVLNSDAPLYGGSGQGNFGGLEAAPVPSYGRPYTLTVTAPPLGMVAFKRKG
jgi:1,4-alpha-glucan branching enzyme